MSRPIDLEHIRNIVLANQREGEALRRSRGLPNGAKIRIELICHVDFNDVTQTGGIECHGESNRVSRIPQDLFYGYSNESEALSSKTMMPNPTRRLTTKEGIHGWVFSFLTEDRYKFTMFCHHDGNQFQVILIHPELNTREFPPQTYHINSCGVIDPHRRPLTLPDTFACSVLWAQAFSSMIQADPARSYVLINN